MCLMPSIKLMTTWKWHVCLNTYSPHIRTYTVHIWFYHSFECSLQTTLNPKKTNLLPEQKNTRNFNVFVFYLSRSLVLLISLEFHRIFNQGKSLWKHSVIITKWKSVFDKYFTGMFDQFKTLKKSARIWSHRAFFLFFFLRCLSNQMKMIW